MHGVAMVSLVAAGACREADEPATEGFRIQDSLGITVVHNLYSALDTTAVVLDLVTRIGVAFGPAEYQFHRIRDVVADAKGFIYVADLGSATIRVFESTGEYVRTIGGRGAGPGEFESVGSLFVWKDTVHVNDLQSLRSTIFDTTGQYLASWPNRVAPNCYVFPMNGGPDGWLARVSRLATPVPMERGSETYDSVRIARIKASGLAEASERECPGGSSIAEYTTMRRFVVSASNTNGLRSPLFEPNASHAVDDSGRVFVADGFPYRVRVYREGRLERVVSRRHRVQRITESDVEALLNQVAASGDALLAESYRRRAELPRNGFVPVIGTIVSSRSGELWLERMDVQWRPEIAEGVARDVDSRFWDVLDESGVYKFTVRMPGNVRVVWSEVGRVIAVERDTENVERIVIFVLRRVENPGNY